MLERLIITSGSLRASELSSPLAGSGILNRGILTLAHSTLAHNTVSMAFQNGTGAGLANAEGTVLLLNSTVADNGTEASGGGLVNAGGTVLVLNSTVARNQSCGFEGGGLFNIGGGTILLLNSTVARNQSGRVAPGTGRGLVNAQGTVTLQNTLLAGNTGPGESPDCAGRVTSLGHNLIGNPDDCDISLRATDLSDIPEDQLGLSAELTDEELPGRGHFALLPGSPAIDTGDDSVCPLMDQLGQLRVGICDIGAIEFQGKRHEQH